MNWHQQQEGLRQTMLKISDRGTLILVHISMQSTIWYWGLMYEVDIWSCCESETFWAVVWFLMQLPRTLRLIFPQKHYHETYFERWLEIGTAMGWTSTNVVRKPSNFSFDGSFPVKRSTLGLTADSLNKLLHLLNTVEFDGLEMHF